MCFHWSVDERMLGIQCQCAFQWNTVTCVHFSYKTNIAKHSNSKFEYNTWLITALSYIPRISKSYFTWFENIVISTQLVFPVTHSTLWQIAKRCIVIGQKHKRRRKIQSGFNFTFYQKNNFWSNGKRQNSSIAQRKERSGYLFAPKIYLKDQLISPFSKYFGTLYFLLEHLIEWKSWFYKMSSVYTSR